MTGEFTAFCTRYYQLTQLLSKREERFNNLLHHAPLYSGQTNLCLDLKKVDTIND